jgi:hypothetical protein
LLAYRRQASETLLLARLPTAGRPLPVMSNAKRRLKNVEVKIRKTYESHITTK